MAVTIVEDVSLIRKTIHKKTIEYILIIINIYLFIAKYYQTKLVYKIYAALISLDGVHVRNIDKEFTEVGR